MFKMGLVEWSTVHRLFQVQKEGGALGVVDLKVYLAPKNLGYSIPAQSYDFCPHLIQLDILDFTLSRIYQCASTTKYFLQLDE